jgi:hypothetical protein
MQKLICLPNAQEEFEEILAGFPSEEAMASSVAFSLTDDRPVWRIGSDGVLRVLLKYTGTPPEQGLMALIRDAMYLNRGFALAVEISWDGLCWTVTNRGWKWQHFQAEAN